jgi:hypothetical protein|nr:MAG TPA: hypothetical protein [Caudoviricetes sp.]
MKIVNKKRFITSITILMIILIALLNKCVAYKSIKTENYMVSVGDTLWSISCEYKKNWTRCSFVLIRAKRIK